MTQVDQVPVRARARVRARVLGALLMAVVVAVGCSGANPTPATPSPVAATTPTPAPTTGSPRDVVLMTHDSFALSDTVIQQFQEQSGFTLKVLRAGDAGAMVNQAILSKSHPLGDVLFGVDNTFLSRALKEGIFQPYSSAALAGVPAELQLDPQNRVTPIDYGDVCLNVDKAAFGAANPAPTSLDDLTKPAHKGQLVVENPATSSPGLAFMLATIVRFGETGSNGWLAYWSSLRANDVLVSPSWSDAYQTQFSAGPGKGSRPIVVSYASSPPAEVYFADPPISEPPTSVVLDGCFRQVEFAGVLAGAVNPEGARAFVDFLLSPAAQADVPLQMFVFPAVKTTPLPDVFRRFAQVPPQPLSMDPAAIEKDRERWIDEWTKTVLR
jgi:thiamine transport system substrate-binding protein